MIVELFSGARGAGVGIKRACPGVPTVGLELDADSCATSAAAGLPAIRCDVSAYPPEAFRGATGMWASPPCTDFSAAGKGAGVAGETGRLIFEVPRWVEGVLPEWVVCEQVPPALPWWQRFARQFAGLGYSVWAGVLNAADFGVPQTRERAFLLASRVRHVAPPTPTHAKHPHPTLFGEPEQPWVSMAEALGMGRLCTCSDNASNHRPARGQTAMGTTGWTTAQDDEDISIESPTSARTGRSRVDSSSTISAETAGVGIRRTSRPSRNARTSSGERAPLPATPPRTPAARDINSRFAPTGSGAASSAPESDQSLSAITAGESTPGSERPVPRDTLTAISTPPLGSRAAASGRRDVVASVRERGLPPTAPPIQRSTASRRPADELGASRCSNCGGRVLTGKASGQWTLSTGHHAFGRNAPRPLSEPAPTLRFGNDVASWQFERPATTVQGDRRIAPPGHRDRAGGERQFGPETVRVTLEELAVLQDLPAAWPFRGNKTSVARQIGNGVPSRLAEACVRAVS